MSLLQSEPWSTAAWNILEQPLIERETKNEARIRREKKKLLVQIRYVQIGYLRQPP